MTHKIRRIMYRYSNPNDIRMPTHICDAFQLLIFESITHDSILPAPSSISNHHHFYTSRMHCYRIFIVIHSLIWKCSLTRQSLHAHTHSLTHPLTHSLLQINASPFSANNSWHTHPPTHSLTHFLWLTHSLAHWLTRLLSFTHGVTSS